MTNKSYPGLSAEHYPEAPTHGTITHVAIHRTTGVVTAIGLDNERLDASLGQQHSVPVGSAPEIGKPFDGVEIERNEFTGQAV
jgi:hypothetical protein